MTQDEFETGIGRLNAQWKNCIGPARQAELWERYEKLPAGVFEAASKDLVFQGGWAPAGDRIDAAIKTHTVAENARQRAIYPEPDRRSTLLQAARRHPDWVDLRQSYPPRMVALHNMVQRSMLTRDTTGMRALKHSFGMNSHEIFQVYELMRAGDTTHPMIIRASRVRGIPGTNLRSTGGRK